jgi:hypothetical protein
MQGRPGCSGGAGPRRRIFSNHYARATVRDLLFQLENLLGQRVDLGVLFVYLFYQRFELRGII